MIRDYIELSLTGVSCAKRCRLLESYGSATEILKAGRDELLDHGLSDADCSKIIASSRGAVADAEMAFIEKYAIKTLAYGSDDYPTNLAGCEDAPTLLYVKGEVDFLSDSDMWISVVGTRKCSDYSSAMTTRLIEQIAEHHPTAVIVSGLAYGIDSVAHKAALDNNLRTVAVLAHGLNKIYPADHRDLAKRIIEKGGALVTEFTTQDVTSKASFLQRNRIVAGITTATLMMESPERGGSLATANLADSYSREVFTLPARATDLSFEGNLRLLRSSKANILTSIEDLESVMGWSRAAASKPRKQSPLIFLNDMEQEVLGLFQGGGELTLDAVIESTSYSVPQIIATLTSLEVNEQIRSIKGKMYIKI